MSDTKSANLVTVASPKGGTGKTTVAYELAAALDAVLIDLDWGAGTATGRWGAHGHARHARDTLGYALTTPGLVPPPAPRPLVGPGRPRLLPGDVGLLEDGDPLVVVERLQAWLPEWGRLGIVDTHPGGGWHADGAVAAADLVLIPTPLRRADLAATHEYLTALHGQGYRRLALVPTMVASVIAERSVDAIERIAADVSVPVLPEITVSSWFAQRQPARAVVSREWRDVRRHRLAAELGALAAAVKELLA